MRFREITEAKKNETRTKGKLKDGTPVTVFVKQEPEKITAWLTASGEFLGAAYFVKADFAGRPGKWVASSTFVNTEWRRKGANTLMYNAVEKLGYSLIPEPRAGKLSKDGEAFWRTRKIRSGRVNEDDQKVASVEEWDKSLPLAGPVVSGLRVRGKIDNLGSIEASFEDYFTLKGIREVPFSLFTGPDGMTRRIEALMADIEESGEITPFIVAIDSHNGPYILEGAHRYDALQYLNKPTFPALVVFDNDDGYFGDADDGASIS